MKEYDEEAAMKQMILAPGCSSVDDNTAAEVLDLIFDYYEENGDLDISSAFDDDADDVENDISEMVSFVHKYLQKNSGSNLTDAQIEAMIRAELDYEESLL